MPCWPPTATLLIPRIRMPSGASWRSNRSCLPGGALGGRNPLLLSALVLTGANLPPEKATEESVGEFGYLTAEEVVGLDLSNLELAVLSACETGLGEVAEGEGVFGLQRAFLLA